LCYELPPPKYPTYPFLQARNTKPYLARFKNDWATAKTVKQCLSDRRKNDQRKQRKNKSTNAEDDEAPRPSIDDVDLAIAEDGEEEDDDDDAAMSDIAASAN
jgi:hypothetical protein